MKAQIKHRIFAVLKSPFIQVAQFGRAAVIPIRNASEVRAVRALCHGRLEFGSDALHGIRIARRNDDEDEVWEEEKQRERDEILRKERFERRRVRGARCASIAGTRQPRRIGNT